MKHFVFVVSIVLCLYSSAIFANPEFKWLAAENSKTQKVAKSFFMQGSLPEDTTRVMHHVDIAINGKQVTETVQIVWFIANQVDVDEFGNDIIYWDSEIENLTIREAGIVTKDGNYKRFKPQNMRITDNDSNNIFTDQKKVVIANSGVSEKTASVLEYQLTYHLSDLESTWSYRSYPAWFSDTLDFSLKVKSNGLKLNWKSNES